MTEDTPHRSPSKSARLVVLYHLDQAGYLEGRTLQEIADVFDVNRSTILRDLRVLDEVKALIPLARARLDKAPVKP